LGEGKERRLSALEMGELRVLEKLKGMEKDFPFLLELDLRGSRRKVEEGFLCSKNQV
jgi:hypothetical protein